VELPKLNELVELVNYPDFLGKLDPQVLTSEATTIVLKQLLKNPLYVSSPWFKSQVEKIEEWSDAKLVKGEKIDFELQKVVICAVTLMNVVTKPEKHTEKTITFANDMLKKLFDKCLEKASTVKDEGSGDSLHKHLLGRLIPFYVSHDVHYINSKATQVLPKLQDKTVKRDMSFVLTLRAAQLMEHEADSFKDISDPAAKLVAQSDLLSGGIETRFLSKFSDETLKVIDGLSETTGVDILEGTDKA